MTFSANLTYEPSFWADNLLISFLHCNFSLIFYIFFDNITIMSHLVYITLFVETDGVTLSRLGCRAIPPVAWPELAQSASLAGPGSGLAFCATHSSHQP